MASGLGWSVASDDITLLPTTMRINVNKYGFGRKFVIDTIFIFQRMEGYVEIL